MLYGAGACRLVDICDVFACHFVIWRNHYTYSCRLIDSVFGGVLRNDFSQRMSDRILYIIDAIIYNADWPTIFHAACGVLLLIILIKYFKMSPLHAIIDAVREITNTFEGHEPRKIRSMFDGILTIASVLFTAITATPFVIEELYQYVGMLKAGIEHQHQPAYLFVVMFFATCIVVLLSLQITRNGPR